MPNVSPGLVSRYLVVLAVGLTTASLSAAGADTDGHVLVAGERLTASRLTVTSGDLLVIDGPLTVSGALDAPRSALTARSTDLDGGARCAALRSDRPVGGGAGCGPAVPFTSRIGATVQACRVPTPFPDCDPFRAAVVVPAGATVALPPGVYGDIRVEGGPGGAGTLVLEGTYALCNLRVSRAGAVRFAGPSTILVQSTITASNGAVLAPAGGLSPAQVQIVVAGPLLRLSRRAALAAHVCVPEGSFRLGSRTTFTGRAVAADIQLRNNIVAFEPLAPETTTTTTTLPPSARCGDGQVDAGEVCDGDVLCTSPSGAFLQCAACTTFSSGPCTTTTTTLPTPFAGRCGDGLVGPGEACDDGNTLDCDTCSARCTRELVGNGIVDCDEECDDGNVAPCDGCDPDGQIECGNGTIETECGEVCDGAEAGGPVCRGGTPACASDCRTVDRGPCLPEATVPVEICGNCLDDDGNGRIDFEDPACCTGVSATSGVLARARLRPARQAAALLRVRARLRGAPSELSPATHDLVLQARIAPGDPILCLRVPAGSWRQRGARFRLRGVAATVPGAARFDSLTLRQQKRRPALLQAVARRFPLAVPGSGTLEMTAAFLEPGSPSPGRCTTLAAPLRRARGGGLRAP